MVRTLAHKRPATIALCSALVVGAVLSTVPDGVATAAPAPASTDASGITASEVGAHHSISVTFSTQMKRQGDVVTSVLLQGPNPYTGRPGWSRCIDLPQSGLPVWTSLSVQLAYPATYTASSYSDFACSNGYNYRWTTGTVTTRFTHWVVYTFRSPKLTLR